MPMSPVVMIADSCRTGTEAKMATELSGPAVMLPEEVIVTSPWVCALMPMEAAPDTDTLPNELMVIGP